MIIVTGGAGFIGSNLVADLNAMGCSDIVVVDTLGCDSKWRNIAKRRFIDVIFPDECEKFVNALDRADAVFHMGANSSTTATDGDEIVRNNFRASTVLWNWCSKSKTPLFYASSAATYGDGSSGFDDDESQTAQDALRPLNLYGWSKVAFDRWIGQQVARGHAPPRWAGLKFFNVYGPNEYHKGDMQSLVAKNTDLVSREKTIGLFKSYKPEFKDGEQLRDFIYVKDCCAVMMWLLAASRPNGIFNLGTGKARSFHDLVLAIGKALNINPDIAFIEMPESIRPNYQYFTEAKMQKLQTAGFTSAFHSLEDGIADYVLSYLTKPDKYR